MIADKDLFRLKLDDFCSLFTRAFKRDASRSFFEWRYIDNPFDEVLAAFEMDDGRLVGNYSAFPCILSYNHTDCQSALSMTTMTDPRYFGKGIFPKLAHELYGHMADSGYRTIWGFPNANSHPGFKKKLRWIDIYEIPTMSLDVNTFSNTNKINESAKPSYDDSFSLDYSFTQRYEDLIFVKKNSRYLQWRYLDNPLHNYKNIVVKTGNKVSSYCVFKIYNEKSIDIVDFQPINRAEAFDLLSSIFFIALDNDLERLNTWAPIHFFTREIFEKTGFRNREPITFFGARDFQTSGVHLPIENYFRWYIQMGDSDVY